jgi:tetratricopeptide (TPR) repeat protein
MKRSFALLFAILVTALSDRARAQSTDSAPKRQPAAVDPRDTLFLRARKLVLDGNGAAGRVLVDSALNATAADSPEYAIALYWRGALAATAADAERDYRRVIVEYPFSPHSGDALLALAQLEMARGDRDPAIDHLQRFLLQRPNDPEHVRAAIWLGRLLLEQNQLAKGCAVLLRTRSALADSAIETRNQVDYYASRCAGVDTVVASPAPAAPPPRAPRVDTTRRRAPPKDTTHTDSVRKPPPRRDTVPPNDNPTSKRFTVQVAAYQTREAADQLVSRLSARSITARVVGRSAPYRVRIGHYASDAEATVAARDLKGKGIEGFVTTTDNESSSPRAQR